MPFPTSKPSLDLVVDATSNDSVAAAALAIAWPQAQCAPSDCTVSDVSGGITNQRRKVALPSKEAVFVRIFGAEGIIDRDVETSTFEALSLHLGRPAFLGRFSNGRVEEWLDTYAALGLQEVSDPAISDEVARQLAKLHAFEVPAHLLEHHAPGGPSALWGTLKEWLAKAMDPSTREAICAASAADAAIYAAAESTCLSPEIIGRAVAELEAAAAEVAGSSRLCPDVGLEPRTSRPCPNLPLTPVGRVSGHTQRVLAQRPDAAEPDARRELGRDPDHRPRVRLDQLRRLRHRQPFHGVVRYHAFCGCNPQTRRRAP